MGKCCTFDIHKYIHTPVSADKDVKMQKALHIKYTVVWNYTLAAYEKWVWRVNLQFRWDSLGGFPFKMHRYNIFVVFTAHHCHWTSLGNAHSMVGGGGWVVFIIICFAKESLAEALGWLRCQPSVDDCHHCVVSSNRLSPAVIYHVFFFCTLKTTRGSINGACGESRWWQWERETVRDAIRGAKASVCTALLCFS